MPNVSIFTTVIHAPWALDRRLFVKRTVETLGPGVLVLQDKQRKGVCAMTLSAYHAALRSSADWHLIVQDDAFLCSGFKDAAQRAISAVPQKTAVSFFYGGESSPAPIRWVEGFSRAGGVAVAVPRRICGLLFSWFSALTTVYRRRGKRGFGVDFGDDTARDMWLAANGWRLWSTNPCLVSHGVEGRFHPSLIDSETANRHPSRWNQSLTQEADALDWAPSTESVLVESFSRGLRWRLSILPDSLKVRLRSGSSG
jgi:hypothetical protein